MKLVRAALVSLIVSGLPMTALANGASASVSHEAYRSGSTPAGRAWPLHRVFDVVGKHAPHFTERWHSGRPGNLLRPRAKPEQLDFEHDPQVVEASRKVDERRGVVDEARHDVEREDEQAALEHRAPDPKFAHRVAEAQAELEEEKYQAGMRLFAEALRPDGALAQSKAKNASAKAEHFQSEAQKLADSLKAFQDDKKSLEALRERYHQLVTESRPIKRIKIELVEAEKGLRYSEFWARANAIRFGHRLTLPPGLTQKP